MQAPGAYVDQIPAGAKPPAAVFSRANRPIPAAPAPAGIYVRVAEVQTQAQAVRAALDLTSRLGSPRPRFIRGEVREEGGHSHIVMFAGPFALPQDARDFCERAMADTACRTQALASAAPPSGGGDPGARR